MSIAKFAIVGVIGLLGLGLVLAVAVIGIVVGDCEYVGPKERTGQSWDCRPAQVRRAEPLVRPGPKVGALIVIQLGERPGWPPAPEGVSPIHAAGSAGAASQPPAGADGAPATMPRGLQ
jgi:hypothetical protein